MSRDPDDDFDHPHFPEGHPLRRHVLYRLRRPPVMPNAVILTVRHGEIAVGEG